MNDCSLYKIYLTISMYSNSSYKLRSNHIVTANRNPHHHFFHLPSQKKNQACTQQPSYHLVYDRQAVVRKVSVNHGPNQEVGQHNLNRKSVTTKISTQTALTGEWLNRSPGFFIGLILPKEKSIASCSLAS